MRQALVFLVLFVLPLCGYAQLSDDFSDGNITQNPAWQGDITDYAVIDGQCRLNADGAGRSLIYTSAAFPDSTSISFYFEINTNPSGGNNSRVYLALDNVDVSSANGLYLQLGEAGSDDAITLFELISGQETMLATATMGAIAKSPKARVTVTMMDGIISLSAAYDDSPDQYEFDVATTFDWTTAGFFGLANLYTASNAKKYAYDDILISAYEPDETPPSLVQSEVLNASSIRLLFDESLDPSQIDPSQFDLDNGSTVVAVVVDAQNSAELLLTVDPPLQSGPTYTLNISGVADTKGNEAQRHSTMLRLAVAPELGDLIINEILFNPVGTGSDYVEVWNRSSKYLQLRDLVLLNKASGRDEAIAESILLGPDELALFTEDITDTKTQFSAVGADQMYENKLPPFNNSDGNISLVSQGVVIDSFDYHEDYHYVLIDDVNGVSLERINPDGPSNSPDNWQSAASAVGFGTPGLPNSNLVVTNPGQEAFSIPKSIFSPNQDGEDDQLVIQYSLDQVGYLLDVRVYDNRGHEVRHLYNNELLGQQGTLFWDGQTDEGTQAAIGAYIIIGEAFATSGEILTFKNTVVLADYLK